MTAFALFFLLLWIRSAESGSDWELITSRLGEAIGVGYDDPGTFSPEYMPGARFGAQHWTVDHLHYVSAGFGFARKGSQGQLGDVWAFDSNISMWSYLRGPDESGLESCYCCSCPMFDNRTEVKPFSYAVTWVVPSVSWLMQFGGSNGPPGEGFVTAEVWIYMSSLNIWWRLLTNQFPEYDDPPYYPPYTVHGASTTFDDESVFIFGGWHRNKYSTYDLLWKFNMTTFSFKYLSGSIKIYVDYFNPPQAGHYGPRGVFSSSYYPPARYAATMWNDGSEFVYVFGGSTWNDTTAPQLMNDLWAWNVWTEEWAYLSGTRIVDYPWGGESLPDANDYHENNWPSSRFAPTTWIAHWNYSDVVVMLGGEDGGGTLRDIWTYSMKRNMWKYVSLMAETTSATQFGARFETASFLDPISGNMFVFSGEGADVVEAVEPLKDQWYYIGRHAECSGHGAFYYDTTDRFLYNPPGTESCVCEAGGYLGTECEEWQCFGEWNYDGGSVCSGRGECVDIDKCKCHDAPLIYGNECTLWDCDGVVKTSVDACNGHGTCDDIDECSCQGVPSDGYSGQFCTEWTCGMVPKASACSGHGVCSEWNVCNCSDFYSGAACQYHPCFGVENLDPLVCSGHGNCLAKDYCKCDFSYVLSNCSGCVEGVGKDQDGECSLFYCGGKLSKDENVCSQNGNCTLKYIDGNYTGVCECEKGYYEDDCSMFDCFDYVFDDSRACGSGNGNCTRPDECLCTKRHAYGGWCDEIISGGRLDGFLHTLTLDYAAPLSTLHRLSEVFDCDKVFLDAALLGPSASCSWEFGFSGTVELHVALRAKQYNPTQLMTVRVRPQSKLDSVVVLSIDQKLPEAYTFGRFVGDTWYIFFIIFIFGVAFCIIAGIVIGVLVHLGKRHRERLAKFNAVDNIEMLIDEHLAEQQVSGLSHLKIDKSMFEIAYDAVELISEVGTGGSGATVWRARWKNRLVAFKVFKTQELATQKKYDDFEREVNVLSSVNHPNILTFFGTSLKEPRVGIVTEFCELGDIKYYMKERPGEVSRDQRLDFVLQIARAMDFLHDRRIIHRDLKPKNVLLTNDLVCKVMDFGLSRVLAKSFQSDLTRRCGTSHYMAPEVVLSVTYDFKCDVFSYGIMIFEILSENWEPFGPLEDVGNIELKVANDPAFRPNVQRDDFFRMNWFMAMMRDCWNADPDARPTFPKIMEILDAGFLEAGVSLVNLKRKQSVGRIIAGSKSMIRQEDVDKLLRVEDIETILEGEREIIRVEGSGTIPEGERETIRVEGSGTTPPREIVEDDVQFTGGRDWFVEKLSFTSELMLLILLLSSWILCERTCYVRSPYRDLLKSPDPAVLSSALPSSWDWRSTGDGQQYVTVVRQQHNPHYCGSCWAVTGAETFSTRFNIAKKGAYPLVNLSPEVILACAKGSGCSGGDTLDVYKYAKETGIGDETCNNYAAKNESCSAYDQCMNCQRGSGCFAVKEYKKFKASDYGDCSGYDKMKAQIYQNGPIACTMSVTPSFKKYTSGIYSEPSTGLHANHWVSVIGWGVESSTEYWIVQNSWGELFGEQGFFRIVTSKTKPNANLLIEEECEYVIPAL